jgi:hypothetical protein
LSCQTLNAAASREPSFVGAYLKLKAPECSSQGPKYIFS